MISHFALQNIAVANSLLVESPEILKNSNYLDLVQKLQPGGQIPRHPIPA
jgi:hypothetical protein